ncbi:MAG: ABC transporter ATP-binding protein, partial [Deltaproteobacteria bacterium]|nr:ABC transporter ATP-binding protein [Deltaproteobacteria bacterium]
MTLVRAYLQFVPGGLRKLIGVVVLSVAGALANGLSIGLLLPALQMVERGARSGGGRWLDLLQQFYAGIGLPMSLLTLLAGALAMILIGQALIYAQVHLATWMSEELVAVLRRYAFERLLKADMEFHQRIRRGTLLNGLMQDLQRTASGFDSLLQALSHAILLGIYVALLVFVSWQLSLAGLALVVVASLLIQFQIRSSHRYGQALVAAFNQLNGFILERTEGIRLVKLGNAMARDHARFVELADRAAKLRAAQGRRGGQIRLLMEPAIAAGGIVSIYIGQVVFGMSLAELAVFLYILVRIVPEAYSLNRSRFNVAGFVSHYTSFRRLLAQAEQATTIVSGPTPFTGVRDGIRFTDVAFAYRQGEPVISRLNLTIDAGKFTAIVGPSGIGKSTLLDLVVRLLEPVR